MSRDIRRMSKDELDELTRAGRAWRERHEPDQAETDAIAEQSKIQDSPKTQLPPFTEGDQLQLL
jgi:hypothetical protein